MGLSRRITLRLGDAEYGEIKLYASERGLRLGPSARALLVQALRVDAERRPVETATTALAALVAAEHAVLMVASILPEGESRISALAERASQAAEERLAMFAEPAAPGAAS